MSVHDLDWLPPLRGQCTLSTPPSLIHLYVLGATFVCLAQPLCESRADTSVASDGPAFQVAQQSSAFSDAGIFFTLTSSGLNQNILRLAGRHERETTFQTRKMSSGSSSKVVHHVQQSVTDCTVEIFEPLEQHGRCKRLECCTRVCSVKCAVCVQKRRDLELQLSLHFKKHFLLPLLKESSTYLITWWLKSNQLLD